MDGKSLARVVAVIFVAVAVTATALEMTRKEERPHDAAPQLPAALAPSPPRESLHRCQILGEVALRDSGCLRLWAEQRDRFLGSKSPFVTSASGPVGAPPKDATSPGTR
ncbi:conjugal transfer protein TrbK [Mesorhizobium sp. M4B.F.Ca.ET.089.01.1.1]|uniref:putative entry exclusion protein TrbK-alt n=1 Tax=Mesorhizobium sp. M4B.F.Ca.ET.089.01.1.1 TaxID=2496662 RepID=UPI000FE2F320|nr:putative entry exclusion protein TrbK-alt [Mesorhizobium sp. M4B.F.Ca.ET.089.01.1.1]RWD16117.1 MAG: conjugal transfer protein TrbK [Mesorhizobium sp.]RWD52191.1 MAG: conjugal transfer protein TrbK [Mesorhizobium sp.]RWX69327.1 conjugal transfer protein TrbK [Mesorhizobium sp. M4B.F.Ca.ET.089.01.1.1]